MSVPQIDFCFEVPNVSRLGSEPTWSPRVFVQGVPWKIQVTKKFDGEKRSIGVYLFCDQEYTDTWSYVASASFKLLSSNDKVKAVEYKLEPLVIDNTDKCGFGTSSFIEWNDLFNEEKHYVKNDTMELYITIQVSDPNRRDRSALVFEKTSSEDDCFAKFSLNITNVRNLMAVRSTEFKMQNLPSKLIVHKHKNRLGVRLTMAATELPTRMLLVKLLSTKGDEKFAVQVQGLLVSTEKLIEWDELLKPENGFIDNNSIKLEVTIVSHTTFQMVKNFVQSMSAASSVGISVPRFRIEIPNIRKLDVVKSPEVTIRGVRWAVFVRKQIVDAKLLLNVYLHCIQSGEVGKNPYVASSLIKLLSFNEMVKAVTCENVPHVFDTDLGYGGLLIGWDELFDANKCFVKNDTIVLDISINVADPNSQNKSELLFKEISNDSNRDYQKFRLTIANIESLVAAKTSLFTMKNLTWNLVVYKHQRHLGVCLQKHQNESCTRAMVVKVLSMKGEGKSAELVRSKHFSADDKIFSNKFISWNELLKPYNGFLNNNAIVMEVTFASNIEDARDLHRPTAPDLKLEPEQSKTECSICWESMKEKSASSTPCGHLYCSPCITNIIKDSPYCPLCRSPVELSEIRRIFLPY